MAGTLLGDQRSKAGSIYRMMQATPILQSHPGDLAGFAWRRVNAGAKAALVFVTAVEEGSVRAPGLRMAVDDAGQTAGFVSNGCIEADVVRLALVAMDEGRPKTTSYGRGSGKIDLQLPCGGRVDLMIVPVTRCNLEHLQLLAEQGRRSQTIVLEPQGHWTISGAGENVGGKWQFPVRPKIRLVVVGSGVEALTLAHLGTVADMSAELVSPDKASLETAAGLGLAHRGLLGLSQDGVLEVDALTAVCLMFHDHDWEQRFLVEALRGPAFYVGALGSIRTHQRRVAMLRAQGCNDNAIARLHAPIGLVHRLRDPPLLGVSVLAEIVSVFQQTFGSF